MSVESRIGELERLVSVLDERVTYASRHVDSLLETTGDFYRVEERLATVQASQETCVAGIEKLRTDIDADRERARLERKADRRWVVGTILTSAALIIAAVGLFAHAI